MQPILARRRRLIAAAALGGAAAGGGSGSAVLTFQGVTNQPAVDSSNTFTALAIGTAFANRRVLVVLTSGASYAGTPTTLTIGGVTATIYGGQGSGAGVGSYSGNICFAWADVPTGTTADVTFNNMANNGDNRINCAVYTFDKSLLLNSTPTTNFANATAATAQTTTVNEGAGGFVVAAIQVEMLASVSGEAVTAATETSMVGTLDGAVAFNSAFASLKSGSTAHAPTSVTWGWTGSAQAVGGLFAWN